MAQQLIVVGASAGGVEALSGFVAGLRDHLQTPVLIVLHVSENSSSVLPSILIRAGGLPAVHAEDGQSLSSGSIFVAPPGHHMTIDGQIIRLNEAPRENSSRPSIDVLFRSAAESWGSKVIGVVLSGSFHDGAEGLFEIKNAGGRVFIQDPLEAQFEEMPLSAMAATDIAEPCVLDEITKAINVLDTLEEETSASL